MVKVNPELKRSLARQKGLTLLEVITTLTIIGIVAGLGPRALSDLFELAHLQRARMHVQRNARSSMDMTHRNLRQATATSIVVSSRPNQPPNSWITFKIDTGTGAALGSHGFYQEGKNLKYMKNGSTSTIADNLRYLGFTYPQTDDTDILSIAMTFEDSTYGGTTKPLKFSIDKVRIMN